MNFLNIDSVSLVFLCTVLGLIVGSFLNVVIYRLPYMMRQKSQLSLWHPSSFCPECQHPLLACDKIPMVSYILLKAKCRYCHTPISPRYPIVEIISAFFSGILAYHFGPTLMLLGSLCLFWSLITLAIIDLTHFLLPDSITLPLLWLGLAFNLFAVFTPLSSAVFGAMLGYLLLWSILHAFKIVTQQDGLGYGDLKLLAAAGAWLGYQPLPIILALSAALAIIIRLTLFRDKKNAYFAFGPYLCSAIVIVLFWQ